MDCIRPMFNNYSWNVKNHKEFPNDIQKIIKAVLLYYKRDNLLGLLSKDIWYFIFSHFNNVEKYKTDKIKYYNKKLKYILGEYNKNTYSDYVPYFDIIKNNYTYEEAEEHIDILKDCNCCPRHRFNRPQKIEKNYKEIVITDDRYKFKRRDCNCNCRHFSRTLNRVFCETIEYYYPFSYHDDIDEMSFYNNHGPHGY